jgi:hypothetical protein
MILDLELRFADGTFAPTATGDNIATNVTDMSPLGTPIGPGSSANLGRDLGQGEPMWFVVVVTQTVTSAGAATCDFRFRSAASADLTTTTPIDLIASGAIGKATLVAGYTYMTTIPSAALGATGYQRYIGANVNIGTAALTAGKFNIALLKNEQKKTLYGAAFTLDV